MVRNYVVPNRYWTDKFECVSIESIIWFDWVSIVDFSRYIAAGCTTSLG